MSCKIINVDGVDYIRRDHDTDWPLRLVLMEERGLLFVGEIALDQERQAGGLIVIKNARCVIRWGTSGHIAELAESGPQSSTKLGSARDVMINPTKICAVYGCDKSKWGETL